MSPKAKKFKDLAAPLYGDPDRRERIETEERAILCDWLSCAPSKA